jgi:hypothetical protein
MSSNMQGQIASLDSWKARKHLMAKEVSLKEYYNLLDFTQLINESKQLRKKLAAGEFIQDMPLHTKLIFDEIQNRMVGSQQKEEVKSFINHK